MNSEASLRRVGVQERPYQRVFVFLFIFPLVNKDRRKREDPEKDLGKKKEKFDRQKEEVSSLSFKLWFLLYHSSFNRMTLSFVLSLLSLQYLH